SSGSTRDESDAPALAGTPTAACRTFSARAAWVTRASARRAGRGSPACPVVTRTKGRSMKRYVCTVAIGFALALAGTGTATAGILPTLGQTGTQVTSFGDQS